MKSAGYTKSWIFHYIWLHNFNEKNWQQDGTKPHQANIVMDWLDTIFGKRMLALKARQGFFWAPSSTDIKPCDFNLWGDMNEKFYKLMPKTILVFKENITQVFLSIPEENVKKTVLIWKQGLRNSFLWMEVGLKTKKSDFKLE